MGNWDEQQVARKDAKEKDRTRREILAKYYLDLSKLFFAALVLGSIIPIYTDATITVNWYVLLAGVLGTYSFANFGNRILK